MPETTRLYAVPQDVAVGVQSVCRYKDLVVHDLVLLVDPATSKVVAALSN